MDGNGNSIAVDMGREMKMVKCILFAVVFSVATVARAGECPRWLSVMPLLEGNSVRLAEDAIKLGNETIVDGIAYICNLTPEGDPVGDPATLYAKYYRETEPLVRRASRMRQGVLLQATMGHGYQPGQPTPWQKCVKPDGQEVYRFCPLDPRFLDYIAAQCHTLAALKPEFFMVDDDTRLVWNDKLPGCFCPLHLAEFRKRTGRAWAREEVIARLEMNDGEFARKWDELKFDSLKRFFRVIRRSFPDTVPGMICIVRTPAHLKRAKEIAEILAATGQIPTIRGSGAPYVGKDIFHVVGQRASYARQLETVGTNVVFMFEADTCPQTLWATSATRLYNEVVMMALEGVKGAKIWITRTSNPHETRSARAYRRIFTENRGLMEWADDVRLRIGGVVVPIGKGNGDFGSQYLSVMGIPYRYGTAFAGEVTALTGETVSSLADEKIGSILSGRVLLEGSAALALTKRGFAKDMGVAAKGWSSAPVQAHLLEGGVCQRGVNCAGLVDLRAHASGVQVLTELLHRPRMGAELKAVAPGSIFFRNAQGGSVVTLAQTLPGRMCNYFEAQMQSESYKTQMVRWLRRLAGRIPGGAYYRGDGAMMCEVGTTSAGAFIVILDALDLDGNEAPDLVFEQDPSRIERLQGDGSWSAVSFVRDGDACRLESPVSTQRPAIFRIHFDVAPSAVKSADVWKQGE